MRTFAVRTLGCKVNRYEGEAYAGMLERAGMVRAPEGERADLCVINGCVVTGAAEGKSRRAILQARRENPGALIAVAGCMAELSGDELRRIGADVLVPNGAKERLPELVGLPGPGRLEVSRFRGRTRGFLKVQDGCDSFCSYCVLPIVRGRPRSRPIAEAVAEARRLAASGHREIVLVGIHLGAYGRDLPDGEDLAGLMERVAVLPGVERLRLSSVEPGEVDGRLLALFRDLPNVAMHLHMPLQSGDDGILRAMNRGYTAGEYARAADRFRALLDEPALTTDVMVGFPGEGEGEFRRTMEFCRRMAFSRMHVFPYSPRPGTAAAGLPDDAPAREKSRRARLLKELAEEISADFRGKIVGKEDEVLVESLRSGEVRGYGGRYVMTAVRASSLKRGDMVRVVNKAAEGGRLLAEPLENTVSGG